jgi:alkylhydroperoxidase family enzyme
LRCWYEWASHVARAIACGISMSEIEKIRNDPKQEDWSNADKAILIAVDELIATHALSADTRKELHQHFSAEQLLDLIAIQGMYVTLGCMINTWGLDLDDAVERQLPANVSQEAFERNHPCR